MGSRVSIAFDWDPVKAAANIRKHGVGFDDAMTIFRDPLALSLLDHDCVDEERWITLGATTSNSLRLVVHTWTELDAERVLVRIISVRRPTRKEARQYRDS